MLVLLAGCRHPAQQAANVGPSSTGIPGLVSESVNLKDINKADVQLAMAQTWENQGKTLQALEAYKTIGEQTRSAEALHRAAILSDQLNDSKQAEKFFQRALKRDPENPVLLSDAGYHLYLTDEYELSEKLLRQSLAIQPDYDKAHANLGMLLARTGRADEAMYEFQRSGCSPSDALTNLAVACIHEGNMVSARRHLEAALSAGPEHTAAAQLMASLAKVEPPMASLAKVTPSKALLAKVELPMDSAASQTPPVAHLAEYATPVVQEAVQPDEFQPIVPAGFERPDEEPSRDYDGIGDASR
jgi:tetratricopeptide (TPR) repeat protein